MDTNVSKSFIKALGFGASLLLTIFAGIFAMFSLCCLVVSVVEADFMSVIGCMATGFLAWMMWSIRKDTLV